MASLSRPASRENDKKWPATINAASPERSAPERKARTGHSASLTQILSLHTGGSILSDRIMETEHFVSRYVIGSGLVRARIAAYDRHRDLLKLPRARQARPHA